MLRLKMRKTSLLYLLLTVSTLICSSSDFVYGQTAIPQSKKSFWKKLQESSSRTAHRLFLAEPWSFQDSLLSTHIKNFISFGYGDLKNTYLSPQVHDGIIVAFDTYHYRRSKSKWFSNWQLSNSLGVANYLNPGNKSSLFYLNDDFSFGIGFDILKTKYFKWNLASLLNANCQVLTKISNVNNAFDLKFSSGLDLGSNLLIPIKLGSYKFFLYERSQLSLLDLTFHPGYGQPYYDYVSGENPAKLHFYLTYPGRKTFVRNLLSLDIPFATQTVSLAFKYDYMYENINYRIYHHTHFSIMLGWSFNIFKVSGTKAISSKDLMHSFY